MMAKLSRTENRKNRWMLFVGIALFLIGLIPILVDVGDSTDKKTYFPLISTHGYWITLLYVCILAPIVEEIVFRIWTIEKKFVWLLSVILQALMYWHLFDWRFAVAVAIVMSICLLIKGDNTRRVVWAIVTSLTFALAHFVNRGTPIAWTGWLLYAGNVGFGLLASWLGLTFSLIWSMVAHICWNSICLATIFIVFLSYNRSFSTEDFSMNFHPILGQVKRPVLTEDTIVLYNTVAGCADFLTQMRNINDTTFNTIDGPTMYVDHSEVEIPCKLEVVRHTQAPFDYDWIVKRLEESGLMKIDTTYENKWLLTVEDEELLASKLDTSSTVTPHFLMTLLRTGFSLPVVVDPALNSEYPLAYDVSKKFKGDELQEYLSYLRQEYGLAVKELVNDRMQVIHFR